MELILFKTALALIAVLIMAIGPAFAILEQKKAVQTKVIVEKNSLAGKEASPDTIRDQARNGSFKSLDDLARIDKTPLQDVDMLRETARADS
jgi:hypothetical protein